VLGEIATEDLLDILFREFLSNEQNKQKEASHNLANIGVVPVTRLLDILRESKRSSERVLVLQLVSEIGYHAVSALIERIEQDGTWYYMRNLVLLLGRIGSEENVEILRSFVNHEDFQVQRETLKSINTIGGDRRGEILLSALPVSDERLKVSIIDTLGSLKYHDAVFPLLELLKSKSFISSKTRTETGRKDMYCFRPNRV
jgi:HEAT repeat protein